MVCFGGEIVHHRESAGEEMLVISLEEALEATETEGNLEAIMWDLEDLIVGFTIKMHRLLEMPWSEEEAIVIMAIIDIVVTQILVQETKVYLV